MENKELSWLEQAEIKCLKQLETDLQQFLSDIFDVKRFQNEDKNLVAWTESEELVDDFHKAIKLELQDGKESL